MIEYLNLFYVYKYFCRNYFYTAEAKDSCGVLKAKDLKTLSQSENINKEISGLDNKTMGLRVGEQPMENLDQKKALEEPSPPMASLSKRAKANPAHVCVRQNKLMIQIHNRFVPLGFCAIMCT